MAVPAEPLTADPASEPPAIDGGEGEVFHPPLHVSQSDPALRSSELPNHQNITIWGRVGHVTEAQQEALRGIKRIHPDLTDREALRYLRARIFNVDKAVELLHASHEWRHLEKPWETDQAIIRPLFESGALSFATKLDQKRRPVMIIDPTTTGTADSETIVRCFQYSLEAAISQLEKDVDDAVFIFDLRNFSVMQSDSKTPIAMIKSLQTGYPERMSMCIMYNPPRIFNMLWKILRYLIDARVHAKIHFVYKAEEIDKLLGEGVRPAKLGGKEPFDYDAWFKKVAGFAPSK